MTYSFVINFFLVERLDSKAMTKHCKIVFFNHNQVLCTSHLYRCYTFVWLTAQETWVHQHHYKHVRISLSYNVLTAAASLGDRNFFAPLKSCVTTNLYVFHHWLKCPYIVHGCDYGFITPKLYEIKSFP
jgi:hypothetical protein